MMDTTAYRKLLKDTGRILNYQKEIAILKGETFNVFSILKMEHKENATHSAFLGELLDPKGSHNLGSSFLELFVQTLDIENIDVSTSRLYLEKSIGPRDDAAKTGGRIDIFIQDAKGNTICIENKIYAIDQEAQIERYCNYNCENNNVYYLTLTGSEPEKNSYRQKESGTDFISISYKHDIIEWLQLCVKEASGYPIIRETISQYIILIKKLTNQLSDSKMENDIKELIKSNYQAATSISSNIEAVEVEFTKKFLKEIKAIVEHELNVEDSNFTINIDEDICRPWTGMHIFHRQWPEEIRVQLQGNSKIPWTNTNFGLVAHKDSYNRSKLLSIFEKADVFSQKNRDTAHWVGYDYIVNFGSIEERAKLFNDKQRAELAERVAEKMIEVYRLCEEPLKNFPKIETN